MTRLAPWLLRLGRPFRLMSSDGDVGIVNRTDNAVLQRLLRSPLLLGWWAQNNLIDHPLMHPLPIGIDLHSGWDSTWPNTTLDRWRAYERVRDAAPPRGRRPVRLFMERFSIAHGSNYNERKDAWARCAASAEVQGARMPKLQMLETYARAQFVLSPRGNGVDCHRTWDVLAVGAISLSLSSCATAPRSTPSSTASPSSSCARGPRCASATRRTPRCSTAPSSGGFTASARSSTRGAGSGGASGGGPGRQGFRLSY